MGIKYSFVDSEIYGAEDVNEIAECLTGAGIMPFLAKDSYSTSDLNTLTAALVTDGVALDGCICTAENAGTAQMCVNVGEGIIFFECGVRLIVDSDGYTIAIPPGTEGYIFAHYNPALQTADIVFAESLPSDGEYVELARIYTDKGVQSTRKFARSKVGTMGKNASAEVTLAGQEPQLYAGLGLYNSFYPYIVAKAEGVDVSKYNFAYIQEKQNDFTYTFGLFNIETEGFCVKGQYTEKPTISDVSSTDKLLRRTTSQNESGRAFAVIDGELCLLIFAQSQSKAKIGNWVYTVVFS